MVYIQCNSMCVYIYTRWLPASLNFHTSAISRYSYKPESTKGYMAIPNRTSETAPSSTQSNELKKSNFKFHIQQRRIHKSSTSQFSKINPILITCRWICYNKFWLFFSSRENGNKLSSIQKLQHQATEETKF